MLEGEGGFRVAALKIRYLSRDLKELREWSCDCLRGKYVGQKEQPV